MKNIQAVAWDLDNTLLENQGVFEEAVTVLNDKYGLTYAAEYALAQGGCLKSLWSCLHNPKRVTFEDWSSDIQFFCLKHIREDSLRPYVREMIEFLHSNKIPQACVSNSPSYVIEHNLLETKIIKYFDHWIGRDKVINGKPHPEPYLKSCRTFAKLPHTCLAIEDSPAGVRSAKAAGMKVIAFPNEHTKDQDLSQADYIVLDLKDLKEQVFT